MNKKGYRKVSLARPSIHSKKTIDGVGDLKFVYFRDPEGNIVEIQSWKK